MGTGTKIGLGVGAAVLIGGAALGLKGCSDSKGSQKEAAAIEQEAKLRRIVESDAAIYRIKTEIALNLSPKCKDENLKKMTDAQINLLETNRQQCVRAAVTNAERDEQQSDYVKQCAERDKDGNPQHQLNTTCVANNFSENPFVISSIVRCNDTLVSALRVSENTMQKCSGYTTVKPW